ncbi:hypothetical protein ABID30_003047 [Enterococcus rotai]
MNNNVYMEITLFVHCFLFGTEKFIPLSYDLATQSNSQGK